MLDRVEALAKETPPVDNEASRFGNPAFKTFYDKVKQVRERPGGSPPSEFQTIRRADLPMPMPLALPRLLRNFMRWYCEFDP